MQHALTKTGPIMPPDLQCFLSDAPLVGDESLENYNTFFSSIADSIGPASAMEWLFVKDIVDLCWQIRRERMIVASLVKVAEKEVVVELLKVVYEEPGSVESDLFRVFCAADQAELWTNDPQSRTEIEANLAAKGYGRSEIVARAYQKAAHDIDACEKRIEGYERRRAAVLKELSFCRYAFAEKVAEATADIIDAEYSEAADDVGT